MIQIYARHSGRESSHVNLNRNWVFGQKTNSEPKEANFSSFVVVLLDHVGLEPELSWMPYGTVLHLLMLKSVESSWSDSLNMRFSALWPWAFCSWWLLLLPLPVPPGIGSQCPPCSWRTNYFDSTPLSPQACPSGAQEWISEENKRSTSGMDYT